MRARSWPRQTPFVGRQSELAMLLDCLDAAASGRGRVVLVSGEAGAGKTRLVGELAERARSSWTVLAGRAYESDGLPPYLPFREALTAYARACSDDQLRTLLGDRAAAIARLTPDVRRLGDLPADPPLSPEDERYRLFESVCDVLIAISRGLSPDSLASGRGNPDEASGRTNPLVPVREGGVGGIGLGLLLVLDDLQWADRPTLLLLGHLARRLDRARLLVVGIYRDTDPIPGPALLDALAALRRERLDERLSLTGLSLDDVEALVTAVSPGGVAPSGLASELHRRTEGNPFFVEELLRGLGEADASDPTVPEGVRDVIARRLVSLSETCRHALVCAAVIGRESDPRLLGQVAGLDGDALLVAVEEAVRAGLLVEIEGAPGVRFVFRHDLVQHAVYESLGATRRERLHARVATAMEDASPGDPAREPVVLAAHYRLAGAAVEPGKALTAVVRAAESAKAAFAWEEAVEQYQTALGLATAHPDVADATRRCDLLLALAEAQLPPDPAGSLKTYLEAAELARSLGTPELLARAAIGYLGENPGLGVVPVQAVQLLEDALRLIGPEDSPLRADLLSKLSYALTHAGDPARRDTLSREAVEVARRAGHAPTLAGVLGARYLVLRSMRRDAEALATVTEMAQAARAADDPGSLLWSYLFRAAVLIDAGKLAEADPDVDAWLSLADQMREPRRLAWAKMWRAERARMNGCFGEAERLTEQALEISRRRSQGRLTVLPFQLTMLRREQGRLGEMAGEWERLSERARGVVGPRIMLALVDLEAGRIAAARDRFESLDADFPPLLDTPESVFAVALRAELCAGLDDRARAAPLYDLLLPYDGSHICTWVWATYFGSAAGYLGLLARTMQRWDAAIRHFEAAVRLHQDMGAALYLAHSRRELAVTLLTRPTARHRDYDAARDLLTQALDAYTSLGAGHRAAQVRELLGDPRLAAAGSGSATSRSRPTYPAGLSQREVEVLRLIAAGKGNQDIADWLMISRFTVVRHVNHILAKTGCANRTEAASYAHRHGIIE